ncbi:stability determinant [Pseudoduganella sp. FT93W]|uniref:Stability determinant n=1 Tax=Duganella fentianensis TaxID=2692177 RepID=A0A845I2R3_9BURK|nr:stability determinant [Duganella fentianensis]MYN45008.1 stability determinant [Duganella fentianensis]
MSKKTSQIASEFATTEEAEAYDHWFRTKVQKSLNDHRPATAHEEVMAALRKIIEAKRDINASDPMAN